MFQYWPLNQDSTCGGSCGDTVRNLKSKRQIDRTMCGICLFSF